MTKKTLTAKLSPKNLSRLEDYADREGISKSEATDRLVKQGLDVEESDMRLVPVKSDGGTIIEDRLDEIERNQLDRLDKIQSTQNEIQEELEPPWYVDLVDKTVLWSWAFTVIGVLLWATSAVGNNGIDGDIATILVLISGVVFIISRFLKENIE
jgi:hypothetical protein